MFGSIFITNFVFIFVVCVLLLAFDFWTVKVRACVNAWRGSFD